MYDVAIIGAGPAGLFASYELITKNNIIKLDLDKECLTKSEEKYSKLLKEQIYWLNRNDDKLYGRSKKIYDKYVNGTLDENIAKRCCKFKLLEDKCKEYNTILNIIKNEPTTQTCSRCGHRYYKEEKLDLSVREFICNNCGFKIGRDKNSAINIYNIV